MICAHFMNATHELCPEEVSVHLSVVLLLLLNTLSCEASLQTLS